jgi:hypothetical protein
VQKRTVYLLIKFDGGSAVVAKAEAETETIVTDEYLFQHPLIAQGVRKSPLT